MRKAVIPKELSHGKLRWKLRPKDIPFKTSENCIACDEIIGQERALKAIQTGLDIKNMGYNIFITGIVGTGRTTTVKKLLEKLDKDGRLFFCRKAKHSKLLSALTM